MLIVCRAELLLLGLERLLSRESDLNVFTYSRVPAPSGVEAEKHGRSLARHPARATIAIVSDRRAPDVADDIRQLLTTLADQAVVLSSGVDMSAMLGCMGAGARCFVMEGDPPQVLLTAVRSAMRGDAYVSPRMLELLVSWLGDRERAPAARSARERDRDRDLLRLLAEGRSTVEIASRLGIAPKTVRNRLSKLYRTLGVRSRVAAVRLAEERGLLDPADRRPKRSS